jgi:hypothetical protein
MLTRTLPAVCLLLVLSGCFSADGPTLAAPPASLLAACPDPVAIPRRDLTGAEIEVFWGRDRTALRTCAQRHGALVKEVAGR